MTILFYFSHTSPLVKARQLCNLLYTIINSWLKRYTSTPKPIKNLQHISKMHNWENNHLSIVQNWTMTARMFVHFAQWTLPGPVLQWRHVGVTIWGQTNYTYSKEWLATGTRRSCKVNWGAGFAAFHSSYLPPFWFLLFLYLREPATHQKVAGSPILFLLHIHTDPIHDS